MRDDPYAIDHHFDVEADHDEHRVRELHLRNNLLIETGWEIRERVFDPDMIITTGSNYMTGNGYLGYRGTFPEWRKEHYVGCVVSDTYDNADGRWTELCNVPNALWATWYEGDEPLVMAGFELNFVETYRRKLSFDTGRHRRTWRHRSPDGDFVRFSDERFASMDELHLVPQRLSVIADSDRTLRLRTGIDGDVWSLHGDHFKACDVEEIDDELLAVTCRTVEKDTEIVVVQALAVRDGDPEVAPATVVDEERSIHRDLTFHLRADEAAHIETIMVVVTSNDTDDPRARAVALARQALADGYDTLMARNRAAWEQLWDRHDITVDGDLVAQTQARYTLYQSLIATPMHSDSLPVGARGLSCQAYQGAAFWDQEVFNLPMFLHVRPDVARKLLTYRWRTLDGAREKARRLDYEGAYYAWISGKTGQELCPDFFFVDVLTGRRIRNHFNDWQMHVSPDISWAVWSYVDVTGDLDFLEEMGLEILVETARFVRSYAFYNPTKDRNEVIRVLGPDEYHENVDNNAFTNYQCHMTLERVLQAIDLLAEHRPDACAAVLERLSVTDTEMARWRTMRNRLYLPQPDPETRVIEQFDGYFSLEDTRPDVLSDRLQNTGEYWGWPNGVAVHTQVIKQADVVQLFAMFPHLFDHDVVEANYDYYEPRTQHGSSLSPSAYGIVAAAMGRTEAAYRWFIRSSGVDLYAKQSRTSGGTFIGGIRTAASAATWLMVTRGFAQMRTSGAELSFAPELPAHWDGLSFKLAHRGTLLDVRIRGDEMTIAAAQDGPATLPVTVWGEPAEIAPGTERTFLRK